MKRTLFIIIVFIFFLAISKFALYNSSSSFSFASSLPQKEITSSGASKSEKGILNSMVYEDISTFNSIVIEERTSFFQIKSTDNFNEDLYLELTEYLGNNINNVGLFYYNLTTKEYVAINENKDFDAASTYKVGMNLLYYYLADKGGISLTDPLTYNDYFYTEGTGILSGYCFPGMEISIEELLDISIIYSDNIATAMLSSHVGGYNTLREKLYSLLNIDYVIYENLITPRISAEILKYIYDHRDVPNFSHLITIMKSTVYHDRLDKYIPYNLVAHKIGTLDSYIHDIGLVFTEEPYIIAIYTEGLYDGPEIIARLSKIIYNKHTSNILQIKVNNTIHDKY